MQLYSYTFESTLFFPSVIPSWVNSCAIRQDYLAIIWLLFRQLVNGINIPHRIYRHEEQSTTKVLTNKRLGMRQMKGP